MSRSRKKNGLDFKSPKLWIVIVAVVVIIALALALMISLGKNITYSSIELGVELVLPEGWEGRFTVEEADNRIQVYSKAVKDDGELQGLLFSIERLTGELITKEDIAQSPAPGKIIAQGNGYTYIGITPTDVQYPADNPEISEEYLSMSEKVPKILGNIRLIGNNYPKARNEGFKVVGSSHFTMEIPDSWSIELSDEAVMRWVLKENNLRVGDITFIPHFTVKEEEQGGAQKAYLQDEETRRKVRIALENSEASILDVMRGSFQFISGPFTSVDMEIAAQQYLMAGGRSVSGKIEEVVYYQGEIAVLFIKEMEYLQGEEANGSETLSVIPVSSGANVLPLAPPDSTNYKVYYFMNLDEFVEDYDYQSHLYKFIIGSDGEIKIILGAL